MVVCPLFFSIRRATGLALLFVLGWLANPAAIGADSKIALSNGSDLKKNTSGEVASKTPAPKGIRVFSCGHSFHMFVYNLLNEMAQNAGIKDHVNVGKSAIGGSRVIQHWDVADEKNQAKTALKEGKIDVLTLAPIWLPDEGIDNFVKLAFEHNPNVRVTVQEYWLPNDIYEPKYPLDTKKKVDHNATDLAFLKKEQDRYDHDIEEYCRAINKKLGKDVILIVPVGQAAIKLREKIVAGKAPGLKVQWDIFRDNWGHPQASLQALNAYCHYAVIYKRSPVGLPAPSPTLFSKKVKDPNINPELNRMLQEIAWETVRNHPMTGVKANGK